MAQEPIWAGSSSFSSGQTPWGLYDSDSEFTSSAEKFADWSARRLGYPIMSVELQSGSFYACFEEAVTEYSAQVNQFNIKDNVLHLTGQATGSNVTHKRVTPTMGRSIFLSKQYGTEAGVGGDVPYYTGSLAITSGSQIYDIDKLFTDTSASGEAIEIKRIYYESDPAMQRFFDPYATTGYGTLNMVEGFGFGNYSPAVSFTLMPLFEDLLRVQAIELNDSIRKSAYSFSLVNNKVRLFPDPTESSTLYFDYINTSDRDNPLKTEYSAQVNQFNIKDNLLTLQGRATGSSNNLTHKRVTPTMGRTVFLSKQYGSEVGVGGDVPYYKGKITINSGSQEYDLDKLFTDPSASEAIEIKRVYYEGTPAMQRFFDPYATTGYGTINMVEGF